MDADATPQYDPNHPLTLLCERCGYVVEDLDPQGPCPECGKPIEESMPDRAGTPWQQHANMRNLVKTWWMTLRHPKRTLDTMALRDDQGLNLSSVSIVVGIGSAILLSSIAILIQSLPGFFFMVFVGGFIGTSMGWLILFTLTAIEAMGLRFIARKRGYRIDQKVSWAIVGHGCVGWVVMSASFMLWVWTVVLWFFWIGVSPSNGSDAIGYVLRVLTLVFFFCGIPSGFIFFEWFAWMGLHRCKYANHPAAQTRYQEPLSTDAEPGEDEPNRGSST